MRWLAREHSTNEGPKLCRHRSSLEWCARDFASEQLARDDAERIDVCGCGEGRSVNDLWCDVARRAAVPVRDGSLRPGSSGEPPVADFDDERPGNCGMRRQQEVVGLQISMKPSRLVHLRESEQRV